MIKNLKKFNWNQIWGKLLLIILLRIILSSPINLNIKF